MNKKKTLFSDWEFVSVILMAYDILAINLTYGLALWIRFDCRYTQIPVEYLNGWLKGIPFLTVVTVTMLLLLRLYKSIWSYASYGELLRIGGTVAGTFALYVGWMKFLDTRMPIIYYILGAMLEFVALIGIRFSYRFIRILRGYGRKIKNPEMNVMIIGAGEAGKTIIKEIQQSRYLNQKVCCIIDDDKNKRDRYLKEIPVVGGRDDILAACEKYRIDEIIFAIPTASQKTRRDILNICKETGCELKSLPGIYQLVNGEVSISKLRKVDVVDLLGRDPIKVNLDEILGYVRGKRVMVTGGGGSIGSELCRQLAGHEVSQLVIFDVYENNAYDIEQELRKKYPKLNLVVLIGSVRDTRKIHQVFETYRPQIVYHAAAHKHVPLMETSPCEAIKNNVLGTFKTAVAATHNGCERFVLISTDKAVNPTNIMGASKRLCEMVIQMMDAFGKEGKEVASYVLSAHDELDREQEKIYPRERAGKPTEFVAVRFGNVLGSNGSVIPLFKKQIEAGGPVTVTHPDIIRYFMTIPEAVSLVLQAGAYARGGEIFILDMGEPVKIDTLARNLIKLSGYQPDVDIQVTYTGLRPGEKLYEEKLMAEEGMQKTDNDLIHIGKPIAFDHVQFLEELGMLRDASYANREDMKEIVEGVVPTYHPEVQGAPESKKGRPEKHQVVTPIGGHTSAAPAGTCAAVGK